MRHSMKDVYWTLVLALEGFSNGRWRYQITLTRLRHGRRCYRYRPPPARQDPPESLVRHTKVSTIPSSNSFLVALMFWWRMYIEDRQTRYRDERAFSGNADIAMTPDWISH
jgi:hypothetical protein